MYINHKMAEPQNQAIHDLLKVGWGGISITGTPRIVFEVLQKVSHKFCFELWKNLIYLLFFSILSDFKTICPLVWYWIWGNMIKVKGKNGMKCFFSKTKLTKRSVPTTQNALASLAEGRGGVFGKSRRPQTSHAKQWDVIVVCRYPESPASINISGQSCRQGSAKLIFGPTTPC